MTSPAATGAASARLRAGHLGQEGALQAVLAAGRRRRSRQAPDRAGRFRRCRVLAAIAGGHAPARRHRAGPASPAGRSRPAGAGRLDPAGAARTRRIAALRRPPLGRLRQSPARPWQQTRQIAAGLAGTRGWNDRIILETGRALAVALADHAARRHDRLVPAPGGPAPPGPDHHPHRRDPRNSPGSWTMTGSLLHRLDAGPARAAAGADGRRRRDWLRTRSQGGPRSRPRDEHTIRMNFNRVHPLLLEWAGHYTHLREVTTSDVTAATGLLPASRHRQTLTALRSLFGHAKKTGTIFRDPTRGVRDGQRPLILIQPLQPAQIDQATSAAITPAARLAVALAAVHAARPKTIRELHLGDVDLGNRRLVITGRARPLDNLTASLLLAWLTHRGRRWPGTANPHLIINQQTAMTTRAVSENWLTGSCRGLTATLERLRVDRQLEEALTCGADPLHLAAVFGTGDTTAIKYATIARQLLATAAEQHDPSGCREPKDPDRP